MEFLLVSIKFIQPHVAADYHIGKHESRRLISVDISFLIYVMEKTVAPALSGCHEE